uniref:Putative phd finger domain protein n=1 Tax=Culex tarsalis TaxID=7177 RepID=A0A1Q3F4E5_CULTA
MGVRKCIIAGCPSTSDRKEDRGVSYHKIPANEEQKQRWWVACRLPDNYVINKGSNLCSRHFRKADFQDFKGTKYLLKNGVIPTIFPWSPAGGGGGGGGRKKKDEEKKKAVAAAAAAAEVVKVEEKQEVVVKKEKEEEEAEASKEPEVAAKDEAKEVKEEEEKKEEVEVKEPVKPEETKAEETPKEEPVSTPVVTSKKQTPASKKRSTPKRPLKTPTSAPSSKKTRRSEPSASTSTPKDRKSVQSPRKLNQSQINFTPGTKIEAQDFAGKWHPAKLGEVDTEEGEVLVQFEKSGGKSKSATLNDEWIPMDSVRLRPFQAQPKTPVGRTRFVVGEKCFARWSDSRKFRATIQAVLDNDMYEVLFDDGFVKVCRANHVSKLKKPDGTMDTEQVEAAPETPTIKQEPMDDSVATDTSLLSPGPSAVASGTPLTALYIPQIAKVSDYPEIPQTGEWFCAWMNDFPVGEEAILEVGTSKLHTVIVADWRLPEGWVKHVYQRFTAFGKMDIILVSPDGKQFRSRQETKTYLAEKGLEYDGNVYDFGLHKRRAKDMGFCRYTQEYKDAFLPPPVPAEPVLLNTEINIGSVKVKIIDNLLQCPEVDCLKTFRKENHLQIHIKHYHKELAKGLGEIPNMQDLAALRSPQVELVETPPKANPRRSQASQSGSKTSIKSEDVKKEPTGDDDEKKLERDPNAPEVDPAKPTTDSDLSKAESSTDIKSPKPEASTTSTDGTTAVPAPTTSSLDPEEAIESHAVTKQPPPAVASAASLPPVATASGSSVKSNAAAATKIKLFSKKKKKKGAKKTKGGFVSKRPVAAASKKSKKKKKAATGRAVPMDYMDAVAEETRHSFANDSFFRHGYGYDPEASQTMTTNASICGQYGGDDSINAAVNSPRFINENGEMIKIVSMKKEEIINCLCGYGEEDGLMVQCELCLCWQHGICNGFERDTQVPDKYVCYICRNPVGGRESRRYIHDQDWLYEGKLPVANYHATNAQKNAARFDILKQSHTLGGNLLELKRFMHSLKVKINIAERKDHPKMYLWSKKWEKSPPRGGNGDLSGIVPLNASITSTGATPSAAAQGATSTGGQLNRTDQQRPVPIPHIPVPEAAIDPAECQAILLEHIQKQQNAAMARLQAIEAQIIALEAYDDKSELLESPTAKNYPKTKQTIHMLLNDLTKMKKIAAIHRSAQQPPPY